MHMQLMISSLLRDLSSPILSGREGISWQLSSFSDCREVRLHNVSCKSFNLAQSLITNIFRVVSSPNHCGSDVMLLHLYRTRDCREVSCLMFPCKSFSSPRYFILNLLKEMSCPNHSGNDVMIPHTDRCGDDCSEVSCPMLPSKSSNCLKPKLRSCRHVSSRSLLLKVSDFKELRAWMISGDVQVRSVHSWICKSMGAGRLQSNPQ